MIKMDQTCEKTIPKISEEGMRAFQKLTGIDIKKIIES